jgi:hypothetical protein
MPPPRILPPRLPGPPSPDYRLPPVQYDAYGRAIVGRGSTPPSGMAREPFTMTEDELEDEETSLAREVFRQTAPGSLEGLVRGLAGPNWTQEEVTAQQEQGQLPEITDEERDRMIVRWNAIRRLLRQYGQ